VYRENPSVPAALPARIRRTMPAKTETAYMVAAGSGEVIAEGAFCFVKEKVIDSEEFVKIYLAGVRKYGELSKAGALMFEFIYRQISGGSAKDRDTISISYLLTVDWRPDVIRRTYERGMRELLEKHFIFRSQATDVYFVNITFMFNGNRLHLVETYQRTVTVQGESAALCELAEA
jgi:hypothetical protein